MRILLVVKSKKMETLGPMYLSAIAKKAGHECRIVEVRDARVTAGEWKPDAVGYSVMTGDQELFRMLNRAIQTEAVDKSWFFASVVGGHHATFFPQDFDWADHVVGGEAEEWWSEFCGGGFTYSINNLDSLPWPDRADFEGQRIRDFIASRGCPHNCSYCYNDRWRKMFPNAKKVRYRDPQDVCNEINSVEPEFVYFQDSCFGVDIKWMQRFAAIYRREVYIPYHCHVRPEQCGVDFVLALHDTNCASVRMGLEAANPKLRKLLHREKAGPEVVYDAVNLLKKWEIKVMVQNILGLPTSTIEDDLWTLEANIRCQPTYAWCSIFNPYPGTELGDLCVANGWYGGDYKDLSSCFFDTSPLEFDAEHVEQLECLQKIFALCVKEGYVPRLEELRHENFEKLVHKIMRDEGDRKLYLGCAEEAKP